jgi:hypothetical protein
MIDDVPPQLHKIPLVNASLLIPGPSSRPSIVKLLQRRGAISVLVRDGRRRVSKVEVSKVTKAQLAVLLSKEVSSRDDHPCHEDKVAFTEAKGVSVAGLNKALAAAYVAPADRKKVTEFYTANSRAGSGGLVLRMWTVTDPAGNSDSVLQLLAVSG